MTNASTNRMTYADSGVDIDAGDAVVDRIQGHMRKTYGPRVLGKYGSFAGLLRLDYNEKLFARNYRDPVLISCTDGVGSKVKLAVEMGIWDTVGQDCVAMNVNDLIVQGGEPLLFLDYIGIHKVIPERIEQIVKGVADGCLLADCALLGGETAELPDLYAKDDFDLAGFAVGVSELKRVVDGSRAEVGDIIIGLSSTGVHSNGYSLVRAIVKQRKLKLDRIYPELDSQRVLGEVLLTPTRIYAKAIVGALRHYKVKQPITAMAHITGGGLPGNVPRVLESDVDAVLDRSSWTLPPVFSFLQQQGNVDDEEMLKVFNMGIGYIVVARPWFVDSLLEQFGKAGETAQVIGRIEAGTGQVRFG